MVALFSGARGQSASNHGRYSRIPSSEATNAYSHCALRRSRTPLIRPILEESSGDELTRVPMSTATAPLPIACADVRASTTIASAHMAKNEKRSSQPAPQPFLTTAEAANILHLHPHTLECWRSRAGCGAGPPYIRIGGAVRGRILYEREAVLAFARNRTVDRGRQHAGASSPARAAAGAAE